jgi:lipid-A-disaccharide synthase
MTSAPQTDRPLRIGIVAGEASGDLLAARLIAALQARLPAVQCVGVGGPHLRDCGLHSLYPMERLAVMGLVEPLWRLPELLRLRRRLYRNFVQDPPDIFIGIDAPDFNLALERKLRNAGIPTAHLVSPSVWAWRRGRLDTIASSTDLMLCLFPFEVELYRQTGVAAVCVGHPRADELQPVEDTGAVRRQLGLPQTGRVLALLPGSRAAEVQRLAPVFLQTAALLHRSGCVQAIVLPVANALCRATLQPLLEQYTELPLVVIDGQACAAMSASDAVLAASGTATLEAALLQRPLVVAYRTGAISWHILSRLVHSRFIALPNILAGQAVVAEFLQGQASAIELEPAVRSALTDAQQRQRMVVAFAALGRELRLGFGNRAAAAIVQLLEQHSTGARRFVEEPER